MKSKRFNRRVKGCGGRKTTTDLLATNCRSLVHQTEPEELVHKQFELPFEYKTDQNAIRTFYFIFYFKQKHGQLRTLSYKRSGPVKSLVEQPFQKEVCKLIHNSTHTTETFSHGRVRIGKKGKWHSWFPPTETTNLT